MIKLTSVLDNMRDGNSLGVTIVTVEFYYNAVEKLLEFLVNVLNNVWSIENVQEYLVFVFYKVLNIW